MQFRTLIPISKSDHPIDYNSRIVSLGSCFAVNMSEKLEYYKFSNTVNPFGILFHPAAIAKLIDFAVKGKEFTGRDVFLHNEAWHCFDAHSDMNSLSETELLDKLNTNIISLRSQIALASHLVITLGTSWVYRNIETDSMVANCHKVPQKQFKKELLPVSEIKASLEQIVSQVAGLNPGCSIIFTVSPVRHIKDGYVENQVSKSHLISAVYDFLSQDNKSGLSYFPSYEIMMDELRDYRFYAEDMLHPNKTAIDYIWERFSQTHVDESSFRTMELVDSIRKGLSHRSFHPDSEQHAKFLQQLQRKISLVQGQFPQISFAG